MSVYPSSIHLSIYLSIYLHIYLGTQVHLTNLRSFTTICTCCTEIPKTKLIFPKGLIIAANRRRPNLSELIKPTIPRRFFQHGPFLEQESFPCKGASISPNVLVICVNMYRWHKMWHYHGTVENGRLWPMSPVNPHSSSTSSSTTVVTMLTLHGTWDQPKMCNKDGGTTGPIFCSKKEKKTWFCTTLWGTSSCGREERPSPLHLRHLPGVCQEGDQAVRKITMVAVNPWDNLFMNFF